MKERLSLFGNYYQRSENIAEVTKNFELDEHLKTYFDNLSAGWKQRVSLAVAPKILQVIGKVNPMNYIKQFYTHIWNGTLSFNNKQLNGWLYLAVLSILAYLFIRIQKKRKK